MKSFELPVILLGRSKIFSINKNCPTTTTTTTTTSLIYGFLLYSSTEYSFLTLLSCLLYP